jgi:alkylation response protein AidB-like acyl-CoA dehydrogenase
MDWSTTEMQDAIGEAVAPILADDPTAWEALRDAGLLDLEGDLEITTLLVAIGRSGARVPALATLVLGAPIARFSERPPSGTILTGGLLEEGSRDPRRVATRVEDGRLYGTKICVPAADRAGRIVVPAIEGVYVAELADCDVQLQDGTDGDPLGIVSFDGTPAERLGGPEVLDWWLPRVDVGVCATLLGLSLEAVAMTAKYVSQREQFKRPIGAFQAVQQRIADAWIDTQAMEVTLWQAAWRISEGLPSERELAIARYHASLGSARVCFAAQHLHGGFGFDRDYVLHRYFLCARQWEFVLGGAEEQLERLGDTLTRDRIEGAARPS